MKIYASFTGDILVLGYGSVGQPITVLLERHLTVDPSKITILEKDNHSDLFKSRHLKSGITYIPNKEITKSNYKTELAKHISQGGLLVNCSLNIDAESIISWCMDNDILYVDTSLERWKDDQDENYPNPATAMITQGSQGYMSFLETRENFRNELVDINAKYRIVVLKK